MPAYMLHGFLLILHSKWGRKRRDLLLLSISATCSWTPSIIISVFLFFLMGSPDTIQQNEYYQHLCGSLPWPANAQRLQSTSFFLLRFNTELWQINTIEMPSLFVVLFFFSPQQTLFLRNKCRTFKGTIHTSKCRRNVVLWIWSQGCR